ncbi:MAG: hypothetical protein KA998_01975 [Rickettsiaceae bacterium]|nr:hypothetical protein [Rickettsiaceae bacterium]
MSIDDLELGQFLIAKFSHDVAGVIGAINSGVDFLKMNDERTRDRALDLLYTSSEQAVAKLQFYRYAYGSVKGPGEANLEEIQSLCEKFLAKKFSLEFHGNYFSDPSLFICSRTGKVITCLVEVVAGSLIYGGSIKVDVAKSEKGKKITVSGSGKSVKIDREKCEIMQGVESPLGIFNVHHHYTGHLISAIPAALAFSVSENNIEFVLNCDVV